MEKEMDIELDMKLTIRPNALKNIIVEYLDKHGYDSKANDVDFVVGTGWTGYGPMESVTHYFEKAVVNVKVKENNK